MALLCAFAKAMVLQGAAGTHKKLQLNDEATHMAHSYPSLEEGWVQTTEQGSQLLGKMLMLRSICTWEKKGKRVRSLPKGLLRQIAIQPRTSHKVRKAVLHDTGGCTWVHTRHLRRHKGV